jgi:hypothetical protein
MKRNENELSNFQTVSNIFPEQDETWRQKIVLTVDLDWCHGGGVPHQIP